MYLRPERLGAPLVIVVIAIVIGGMAFAAPLVSWIMMATFFAILVRPFQTWLLRHRVPSVLALIIISLLLLGIIAGLAVLVGVSVKQMVAKAPTYQADLTRQLTGVRETLDALGLPLPGSALIDVVNPGMLIGGFLTLLRSISGIVFDLFYILLLVLFLLVDGSYMMARLRTGLGEDHPLVVRLSQVGPKVVRYFGIRAYVNLLTGAGVAAALWLLGIDYALLWGTLLFFFSFVPYIGIFLASIPPVLLALAEFGPAQALIVVIGITTINLALENIVMPRMVGTSLSIAPTIVLVSFSFWTWLLGGSGALLSVFLTILAIVIFDSFERTRWLAAIMTAGDGESSATVEPDPTSATVEPVPSGATVGQAPTGAVVDGKSPA